jgi:hypothetical protein
MRCVLSPCLLALALLGRAVLAQTIVHDDEHLATDRPEAWAMNHVAASTFLTALGESPAMAPGRWDIVLEATVIPRLSDAQQQVGFRGFKKEDLNRSPVFGRLRVRFGLPAGWVAEVAYTPPLEIHGTRPRDLFAVAIGHRIVERAGWTLSARAFGQHGAAQGDITCPARLAGVADREENPSGCVAASDDRIELDYYGVDVVASRTIGRWRGYADLGAIRSELAVQVDAPVFDVRDRSRLTARNVLPYIALGATYDFDAHWSAGVEGLYVPLVVKREDGGERENDPFTTVRVQLRYRID